MDLPPSRYVDLQASTLPPPPRIRAFIFYAHRVHSAFIQLFYQFFLCSLVDFSSNFADYFSRSRAFCSPFSVRNKRMPTSTSMIHVQLYETCTFFFFSPKGDGLKSSASMTSNCLQTRPARFRQPPDPIRVYRILTRGKPC